MTIGVERRLDPNPHPFCHHMVAFALFPPSKYFCGKVVAVKGLSGHKHVAFVALGVGLVTLLQDFKCAMHVVVYKMNPDVGPDHIPPLTPLHQALNNVLCLRRKNPIVMDLLRCVCVCTRMCVPHTDLPIPRHVGYRGASKGTIQPIILHTLYI